MEYHKLSFKKDQDAVRNYPNFLYWIVFDGNGTDYAFDEAALKVSSEKDGVYPLVVCGCDCISCGGMYVSTRIEGEDIVWEKFWQGQCSGEPEKDDKLTEFALTKNSVRGEDLIVKPPLRFNLNEYRILAEKIERDRKSDPAHSKGYNKTLETYKSGNTFRM
jgi:hypothetical protein